MLTGRFSKGHASPSPQHSCSRPLQPRRHMHNVHVHVLGYRNVHSQALVAAGSIHHKAAPMSSAAVSSNAAMPAVISPLAGSDPQPSGTIPRDAVSSDRTGRMWPVGRLGSSPTLCRPAWLDHPELAEATEACLLSFPAACPMGTAAPDEQIRSRCRRLLQQELGYIDNPLFRASDAAARIFAEPLDLKGTEPPRRASVAASLKSELPAHLRQLCAAPLLTPVQELQLFQRMNFLRHEAALRLGRLDAGQSGQTDVELVERLIGLAGWHRDRICEANVRLVVSIIKRFVGPLNDFDELLSDGLLALMRAVDKFNYDRGFRFSTYATQVVRRNACREAVQNQTDRQKVQLGLTEMGLEISDEAGDSTMTEQRRNQLQGRLAVMLGSLERRERFIIRTRFSLGAHRRTHSLQAVADRLGISKERVRQLEKRALEKLQAMASEVPLVAQAR